MIQADRQSTGRAQSIQTVSRRGALILPFVAAAAVGPVSAMAVPAPRPGHIWVQVPEKAWRELQQAVRQLSRG